MRNRFAHVLVICFLILVITVITSFLHVLSTYASTALDSTYGTGGTVITTFGNDTLYGVRRFAQQSDGKTVAVGANSNGGHYNWAIARYNINGSLDTSFGTNGVVTQDFGYNNEATGVAIQPADGKILVAGANSDPWTVGRYNSDGSLDTSFGNNGIAIPYTENNNASIANLLLQSDGKIITAGSNGGSEIVVRQNSDGSPDQTFGNGGTATNTGQSVSVTSSALQSDGKIVVYGDVSGSGSIIVSRFNSDGSIDTTFGNSGSIVDQFGDGSNGADSITTQPSDGKILVTGNYSSSGNAHPFVIRFTQNGSHDATFGSGGYVLGLGANITYPRTTPIIQSDGKIILGGSDQNQNDAALARINADGTLDTSFGTNGYITTHFGTSNTNGFNDIALQTDGKILGGGFAVNGSNYDWALARYVEGPSVGAITAPSSPVLVNTAITASANFTDSATGTHTATWNWGDGSTTGTVTEPNGTNPGSVSNTHTYTATGVYTITLTVTNTSDSASGSSTYQYVAVYDSSTSFAGGRSFDNPSSASPSTTGKVSFGVSAKYNNSNVLMGNAKMNFKAATLDFVSTSLSSLATSNGRAYLKGSGTLNGNSGYTFLATGIDGSVAGGSDLIRFQIQDSSNNVMYDSQPGAGDTADPTTVDATGNIRVH